MLLSELLLEAKQVYDFRHKNVEAEFPFWGDTKTSEYISPEDGFYFTYYEGELLLASTQNESYSGLVAKNLQKEFIAAEKKGNTSEVFAKVKVAAKLWNQLGGVVDFNSKIITISKESANNKKRQRALSNIKELKDALKNLLKYGVKEDFKIKGAPVPLNGMTVKQILNLESGVDSALKREGQVLYHGTSLSRWNIISKQGLLPGKTGEAYADLIPGYSDFNVYLAANPKVAEFYGKRQAKKDGDTEYVILEITVPDPAKFKADDAFAWGMKPEQEHSRLKASINELGSIAYKGSIKPQFIKLLSTKKA